MDDAQPRGPFETMTWLQAVRLTGGLFIAAAVVVLIYVALRPPGPGYHPLGVALPALVALVTGGAMLLAGERFDRRLFYPLGPIAVLVITIGQYFSGQQSLGLVLFVWVAVFSFYLHSRRHAIANLILVGVALAGLLGTTKGNAAPIAIWLYLMSTVAITAGSVSWLIERVNRLAVAERLARQEAEAAGQEVAELNRILQARVQDQVHELDRLSELKRFLTPQIANAIRSPDHDATLAPHRREIAVLFCDLRGFTAFSAGAEPEEVLEVLGQFHAAVGEAVRAFEATLGAFAGDGVMVYFNDPVPCVDPAQRAVDMAIQLRTRVEALNQRWRDLGHSLGLGIGVALGYASLGIVGYEDRREYTPLGTVVNLASRLCDEALPGQILIDRRARMATIEHVAVEPVGDLMLKGFPDLVPVYSVSEGSQHELSESRS